MAEVLEVSGGVAGPGGWFDRLCRGLALVGGLLLLGVASVTAFSVTGRYLFNSPLSGDSEILRMFTAMAVALFMPHCQLAKGHVIVDVFTSGLPARARMALDEAGTVLLAAVAAIVAWRMFIGATELRQYRDQTMVLRIPTWWAFTVIVPAMALLAVASLVTIARDLAVLRSPPRP